MEVPVNYFAVLVSALFTIVLGTIWYGPLFGKTWAALVGLDENRKPKGMAGTMLLAFVSSFVSACVISRLVVFSGAYLESTGVSLGIMTGILVWLGFALPLTLGVVLWELKSWKLWLINSSYYLISFVVQAIILATWL